jgi:NAD(P)H-hydrate repair Nnr-like enzyme with NAD(P)H-hydrate dehydratase domain
MPAAAALVVGPGLTDASERGQLPALYREDARPAVWDASALIEIPGAHPGGPRVLTPHPAEAARLLSLRTGQSWTAAQVQADRVRRRGRSRRAPGRWRSSKVRAR